MASGLLIDYLGSGTAASRPASPSLYSGSVGIYYATDTSVISFWDGSTWDDYDADVILDAISSTQGVILYRGAAGWAGLAVGTNGEFLQTTGAASDPQWATPDIQALLDGIGTTQGTILYYNGTNWVALAVGTAGYVLQTNGAAANPSWEAKDLRISGGLPTDTPTSGQVLFEIPMLDGDAFPADMAGSILSCGTAATSSSDFLLKKNGTTFNTITVAASGTTGSFSSTGVTTFSGGDILSLEAPATADATLASVRYTFVGTRA